MNATVNGSPAFIVVEQQVGRYTPHLFENEVHFKAWCQVHRPTRFIKTGTGRGRCVQAIDHRGEVDFKVSDALTAIEAGERAVKAVRIAVSGF